MASPEIVQKLLWAYRRVNENYLIYRAFYCHIGYCVRPGHIFTKSKSPFIYEANSKVTTRSNPEKTAMKWTTELSSERISMIEGICRKSMEKFGYANYSISQMTLTDILSKKPQWTKIVNFIRKLFGIFIYRKIASINARY